MSEMSYLKVFLDWDEATRKLKDAEKGRLIDALVAYAKGAENADSRLTGNEAYVFPVFQLQIDRDKAEVRKKSETNGENGKKGGAPKGNQNARKNNRNQPETTGNNRNNPDKDHDHDNDYDHNNDNTSAPLPPAGGMAAAEEADPVFSRLLSAYSAYCPKTPEKKLAEYCRSLSPEVCFRALDAARDAGRKDWKYINGILRIREEWGVRSLADWDRADAEWRRNRTGFGGNPVPPAQNAGTPEQSADERWGIRGAMLDGE